MAGVVFADSGYVSAQVKQDLLARDVLLVPKPTAAMVDEAWSFERQWGRKAQGGGEYRKRQIVEGVFAML